MSITYYTFDGVPVATWITDFLTQLDTRCAQKRASDEEVARLAGMTIAEFDADTTALDPDTGAEEQAR